MSKLLIALTGSLVLTASTVQAEDKITLCSGEWAPFISQYSPHYGSVSHLVGEAFKLAGVEVDYQFYPWRRTYAKALLGGDCMGTIGYAWSPDREAAFYYSAPVLTQPYVFFHLKNKPLNFDGTIESLRGRKIGGIAGAAHLRMHRAHKDGVIEFQATGNIDINFRKLLHQRFDGLPLSREVGYHYIRKQLSPEEQAQISHAEIPIGSWDYHVILSRKNERSKALIERFNRGLRELKESQRTLKMQVDLQRGLYDISEQKKP